MLAAAAASLVAMFVDPRIITGAPAWLKPFKFAISTAVYSLTLAWIFGWLSDWPRIRRVVGWTTAIVFVLEVVDDRRCRRGGERPATSTCLPRSIWCCSRDGLRDLAADARERGGRRRPVAAAVHRPAARMGPATGHDADHRRRADRPADDPPDGGAAGGRARRQAHDDRRRAYRRRTRWRSGRAGDRVEPGARRSARSPLHRPARDPGADTRRHRPEALAPARGRSGQGAS